MKRALTAALVFTVLAESAGPAFAETPRAALDGYLAAARAGDWDTAASYWLPEDVARSERLGVTYRDVPFKLDAASYLMWPGVAEAGAPAVGAPVGDPETGPLRFTVTFPTSPPTRSDYVAAREDDRWFLASPSTALSRDWDTIETGYIRFRVQPGRQLIRHAAYRLNRFVDETGARLGIPPARMERLAREKIDYLLCDEQIVEAIAGAPTRGVSMLPVDAVVTSERAHAHELAHLLVGYAAADLGLHVLPVLQEGIAVHLGGRWGRSPAVLAEMGRYVLAEGFAAVDSFLAWQDFRNQLPDLVYAPAGILAGYLLAELGPEDFLDLYRDYSGWPGDLAARTGPRIAADFERRLGLEPGGLADGVAAWAAGRSGGGIEPGGEPMRGKAVTLEGAGLRAAVAVGAEWVRVEVTAEEGEPAGALLLPGDLEEPGRIFAERLPGRVFGGETGAVIFNGREAGYYDFAADVLAAKYVHDFRPDPAFRPGDGRTLVFRIDRNLLPAQPSAWILVPTP